jgi:hypothetical protein
VLARAKEDAVRTAGRVLAACCISTIAIAAAPIGADVPPHSSYLQQLERARADYFAGIDGDGSATDRAFACLEQSHPDDATLMAYSGTLELIEAARIWAVWNKHKLAVDGLSNWTVPASLLRRAWRSASSTMKQACICHSSTTAGRMPSKTLPS